MAVLYPKQCYNEETEMYLLCITIKLIHIFGGLCFSNPPKSQLILDNAIYGILLSCNI